MVSLRRPWQAAHLLALLVAAALAGTAALQGCGRVHSQAPVPETIFVGDFITLDSSGPRVEAIAVEEGRIVAAGSRAEIGRLAKGTTRTIDIGGVAVPGFADAHVHVSSVGQQLERINLRGLTREEILAKVADAVRSLPPGAWVSGSGWDQGFFKPPVFPTAADLDAVSGDHPVVLTRIDGHSSWVNSKVLALAGITRTTPDPDGGRIERNAAQQATGILVDQAQELVSRVRPTRLSTADRERRVRAALQQFAGWGLTSVHDAGTDLETIAIYKNLLSRGELTVRLYAMASGSAATRHYLASGPEIDLGKGLLTIRSFKVLLDGALGSRGAELTEPYTDAPGEHGLQQMKDADFDTLIQAARQKGFQVNAHAIGDRAVTRALDGFERGGVAPEDRFRIEHASMVVPDDQPRFARLGIIASMQPVFVGEYSRWAEDRVGPSRVRWVLPTGALAAKGAAIAFGSDFTASDSGDPIDTLYGAVTRKSEGGQPEAGWYNDQRIDVDKALRLMSAGPAFAAFQDKDLGQLSVGRYADFTVLSADPYKVPPEDLRTLVVRMTVVAGRPTFESAEVRTGSRR